MSSSHVTLHKHHSREESHTEKHHHSKKPAEKKPARKDPEVESNSADSDAEKVVISSSRGIGVPPRKSTEHREEWEEDLTST